MPESDSAIAGSSPGSTNPQVQPQLTDQRLCEHPYWPLRLGTTWTFNSPHTSYTLQVNNILANQVYLSTSYEGQGVQSSLVCNREGLTGGFFGDMRRITEFGDLTFSNQFGVFLPQPEVMEKIGSSWTQEFQVSGHLEAVEGDQVVGGKINQGQATTVYTSIGFETLKTPLGPRQALRLDQELNLGLKIDFDLNTQNVRATEVVKLKNAYWYVKGIGLVKLHWQGGTMQQAYQLGDTTVNHKTTIPALAEEYLIFVCVLSDNGSANCMQIDGISQSDLTAAAIPELEIESFVFPDEVSQHADVDLVETITPGKVADSPDNWDNSSSQPETIDDEENAALLAYAKQVARLGERINEAAEGFGKIAIAFRNGEVTLEEFKDKFESFASKIEDLIQEINQLSPPESAEAIHRDMVNGLDKCDEAIDLTHDWFDDPNSETKETAALLVAACISEVTAAADELDALVQQKQRAP